jgi:hypothetical protein
MNKTGRELRPYFDNGNYNEVIRLIENAYAEGWVDYAEILKGHYSLKSDEGGKVHLDTLQALRARLVNSRGEINEDVWIKSRSEYLAALQAAEDFIEKEPERQAAASAQRVAAQIKASEERAAADKKAGEERAKLIAAANAKGVTAEDFDYDLTRNGKGIVIKGYKGLASVVTIPAVIEGFPVHEIADGAFKGNVELVSVTIPDSVTYIEDSAFEGCTNLKTASLPRNMKAIPEGMFKGCTSLETVSLPAGLQTVGDSAFRGCTALKDLTLPAGLQTIGYGAFRGCTALKAISFPDSVTEIGLGAFMGCTGLSALVLPKNLKKLGEKSYDGIFKNCTGLASVTFQSNNLEIWHYSFDGCSSLTTLIINANIGDIMGDAFTNCPISTVTIGPNVTRIRGTDSIPQDNLPIATRAKLKQLDQ